MSCMNIVQLMNAIEQQHKAGTVEVDRVEQAIATLSHISNRYESANNERLMVNTI